MIRARSSPFSTDRNDTTRWVAERIEELEAPLLVCEPVLTEAIHLLGRYSRAQDALLELLQNGALSMAFQIEEHVGALRKLLRKYGDRPISLADACVVRMAEIHERHARPDAGFRFHGVTENTAGFRLRLSIRAEIADKCPINYSAQLPARVWLGPVPPLQDFGSRSGTSHLLQALKPIPSETASNTAQILRMPVSPAPTQYTINPRRRRGTLVQVRFPAKTALPAGVSTTRDDFMAPQFSKHTKPSRTASSQIDRRGQVLLQASIASP